jgi:hypothetical protein
MGEVRLRSCQGFCAAAGAEMFSILAGDKPRLIGGRASSFISQKLWIIVNATCAHM